MAEQKHTQDPLDMEEALSTSEAFLIKYKGKILGTIAAVVIIIAGFMGYKHFISEPNEMKASEALFKGEQYFGADNFETALNGDSIGYKGFLKVADEFSGTAAGNLANAYAGICYAQLGKYEDAVKYLDKFSAKDQLVSPAILGTIGNCYADGAIGQSCRNFAESSRQSRQSGIKPYLFDSGRSVVRETG